ncbi:hypothetical protein CHH83_12275 [Bacillus sp. 7586-K]|nr:hypothetical protein CHH83_12275 [Bacillus sp. 7586-K]
MRRRYLIMRIEDEIFELIRNSPELKPREHFIQQTKMKLMNEAKKYNQRQKLFNTSFYWSSIAATIAIVIWISFFGGITYISDSVSQVMASFQKNTTPQVAEDHHVNTPISTKNPTVFIYHTHNTESFTTLASNKKSFSDSKKNITLVGKKLNESLRDKEIYSLHNKIDIQKVLKNEGLKFEDSYKVSREIIKEVLEKNKDIKLVLDIHRDSSKREESTIKVNGKNVSRISFVVSAVSSKYEENRKIADLFHHKLQDKYPGISRGVLVGGKATKNNYNQDLFDNSLLIEIGGPENTLEEEYRSVEILSEVIIDVLDEIE